MAGRGVQQSQAMKIFRDLQDEAQRAVALAADQSVAFHTEPSRHFFVYRAGRSALRLDVKVADDNQSIEFATDTRTTGRFRLAQMADGQIGLFNGEQRATTTRAATLLLTPFWGAQAPQVPAAE